MSASLDVIIRAKDEASQVLRGLNQELAGVGTKGQQTATQLGAVDKAFGSAKTAALGFGAGLATALVTDKLVAFGRASIDAASDLNESMSKTQVVFQENAAEVVRWSETSAEAFGQSQQQALEAASTLGNLFTAMGVTGEAAAGMSMELVELASDLASFNNIGTAEALEKLRAGLVGEVEPLRTLGVQLSEAAVQAEALEMGLADTADQLTAQDKVMARYKLIMEQTATAQGDFERTSEGLANQQRILDAQLQDMQATIGQGLLPAMVELTSAANDLMASPLFQAGLEGYSGQIEEMAGALGTMTDMARAAAGPLGMVNDRLDLMSGFSGALDSMVKTALPGYGALSGVADGIGLVRDRLQDSSGQFDGFIEWMDEAIIKAALLADPGGSGMQQLIDRVLELTAGLGDGSAQRQATAEELERVAERTTLYADNVTSLNLALSEGEEWNEKWHTSNANVVDKMAELWDASQRVTESGHRFNQMLEDSVGQYDSAAVAAGHLRTMQDDLMAVNDIMNQRIEESAGAISLWEGRVSGVEEALGYLDEQLAAGNITHEEHAEKVGKLTEFQSRLEQGIQDDLIPAFVDEQLAAADLQTALDDLDEKVKNNEISQEDAAAQARDLKAAFEEQTNPVGTLIDKIGELIDTLIDLENQDPEVTITANADAVQAAIESMRDYAANNPINVPINAVVAGGNDAVSYAVGGDGGSAGMGDQAAFREKAFTVGEDAGRNFSKGFVHGASTQYIEDAKGVAGDGVPIGNDTDYFEGGREDGREYGEGFGDGFEGWLMADWQRIQNEFLSEGGLVGIMTGESQSNLQDDIRAMEAYLAALLQAGFSTDSDVYQTAYSQYQEFLLQLEAMNAIAGTESAQEYWDAYLESLPKQEIGPAFREIGDDAGREFGRAWVDGVLTEDWWGLGRDIAEDMTEGAVFALDTFDWSGTGYSAGQEFAAGAVTGIAEGFAKNPDTTFGKPPASATDSPPPGMIASGGAGGSAMFWQGGFNIPMDVYGPGPYDSAFLYEQSQRQNPNRRNRGGGMQPIVINQNIMLDGDVIDRRTEKVMARLAMEAI